MQGGLPQQKKIIIIIFFVLSPSPPLCDVAEITCKRKIIIKAFPMHQFANKAHKLLSLLNKDTKCGRLIK